MKMRINKWISLLAGIMLLASLDSCIKDKGYKGETVFSNLQDHVEIVKSGLTYYSSAGVLFNGADTATLTLIVNLASVNLPTSPTQVTIGVDAQQIATYNTANNTSFQIVPSASYSVASTSLTIPAGQQYAQTTVSFYADSLDPSVSYMLPISITDASGHALTSNQNTVFYHIIGNPIAGTYEQYFSRWLAADSTGGSGTANYYNADFGPTSFSPSSPTEVQATSNAFGEVFTIDFSNNAGVLSNFSVSFPANEAALLGLPSFGPPTFEVEDHANGYYKIVYPYVNGAGATRLCVSTFIKQ